MIFLLLQLTHNASDGRIGVADAFTDYIKFLPESIPLPTFWSEEEISLVRGTSLELALETKLSSLEREFLHLEDSTGTIDWCRQYWWDVETGQLTLEDWKFVDATYRSRALDLPGTGHATVPCIDMANHASDVSTGALYETDEDSNAILVLANGKTIKSGNEVTITYGDQKGACEMLFSYGFLEAGTETSSDLFLDIELPDDDPLALAKRQASIAAPGFRLYQKAGKTSWEGPFIWLLSLNEEDGLDFKVAQSHDGTRELQLYFQNHLISDGLTLLSTIREHDLWDVFQLRAATVVQSRVEEQLLRLKENEHHIGDAPRGQRRMLASRLRASEEQLMFDAYQTIAAETDALLQSPSVQAYLSKASEAFVVTEASEPPHGDEEADDFS